MRKTFLIILTTLVILVVSGVILFDVILEGILKQRLESTVQSDKERIYDYTYTDISVKFIAGELVLSDLVITPRKEMIDSLKMAGVIRRELFEIRLEEFRLEDIDSWKLILKNEIHIGSIVFDRPEVKILLNKEAPIIHGKQLAGDIIMPNLKLAKIDSFILRLGSFEYLNVGQDTSSIIFFDSTNISFYDLRVDSTLIATGEIFEYNHIVLDINNIEMLDFKDFDFSLEEIKNNYKDKELHFRGIRIKPKLDKYAFMKNEPMEADWFDLSIDHMMIHMLDVPQFQRTGVIIAEAMFIDKVVLELYRDKRLPDRPQRFKPLLSQILREMDLSVNLNSLAISGSEIIYTQWPEKALQPMVVSFKDVNISAAGLRTGEEARKPGFMTLEFTSEFMERGKVDLSIALPLNDTTNAFNVKGKLSGIPLASLNPILEPAAFVKFDEGILNFVEFELDADEYSSQGWLDLDYQGLKGVTFMRNKDELMEQKESKRDRKETKKLLSFLADKYIQNDYGPDSKNYYQGKISCERDDQKSVFNYLIRSLQSGVVTCLMPKKQENYHQMKKERRQERKTMKKEERKSREVRQ